MKTNYPGDFLIKLTLFFALTAFFTACNKDLKEQQVSGSSANTNATGATKPNIILIIGDDIGREIPTYNGGQSYSTPSLDFLAANGMQFPYFFSHPDGPPSRLAMVTGEYSYRNWEHFGYLPPSSVTFANMFKSKGYNTCFTGKWQFDGGDASIKSHGFDKYLVFMPFNPDDNNGHDQFYRRYKNPYLYTDAHYLSDAQVAGKYSEDMFYDYASKFIDSNKSNPFLLVYSHNLVQKPWVPSPDHPDYAAWNPAVDDDARDDTSYFPSMVSYMDKIIGKLRNKVEASGLSRKTLIIFVSDNATNKAIRSTYKGKKVRGAKDSTDFNGINVPMVAYMPGTVAPGVVDTSLVDMVDFFPTFCNVTGTSLAPYQPLDGKTFYDNLKGTTGGQRTSVYCYWPRDYQQKIDLSYVTDYNYKLYDSLNGGKFYNIRTDVYEKNPIPNNQLTDDEKKTRNRFKVILRQGYQ
jgi:arylsulfatase A